MPKTRAPSHPRPRPAATPATSAPPAPPTLPEQKLDFTAEGAPAPGKVAHAAPVTPPPPPAGVTKRRASRARYP